MDRRTIKNKKSRKNGDGGYRNDDYDNNRYYTNSSIGLLFNRFFEK